jgi:hypothetical protein
MAILRELSDPPQKFGYNDFGSRMLDITACDRSDARPIKFLFRHNRCAAFPQTPVSTCQDMLQMIAYGHVKKKLTF